MSLEILLIVILIKVVASADAILLLLEWRNISELQLLLLNVLWRIRNHLVNWRT